jgi:type I restriction enzyme R subunit
MFNEENSVEQMALDTFCGSATSNMITEELACFQWESM